MYVELDYAVANGVGKFCDLIVGPFISVGLIFET